MRTKSQLLLFMSFQSICAFLTRLVKVSHTQMFLLRVMFQKRTNPKCEIQIQTNPHLGRWKEPTEISIIKNDIFTLLIIEYWFQGFSHLTLDQYYFWQVTGNIRRNNKPKSWDVKVSLLTVKLLLFSPRKILCATVWHCDNCGIIISWAWWLLCVLHVSVKENILSYINTLFSLSIKH